MKRLNWKIKLVITIISAISLVVVILYMVTYLFFSSQLRRNDEKIAQINFRKIWNRLLNWVSGMPTVMTWTCWHGTSGTGNMPMMPAERRSTGK